MGRSNRDHGSVGFEGTNRRVTRSLDLVTLVPAVVVRAHGIRPHSFQVEVAPGGFI